MSSAGCQPSGGHRERTSGESAVAQTDVAGRIQDADETGRRSAATLRGDRDRQTHRLPGGDGGRRCGERSGRRGVRSVAGINMDPESKSIICDQYIGGAAAGEFRDLRLSDVLQRVGAA